MTWSPQQDMALQQVSRWYRSARGPQVFRLFGFAGTGKSTLARAIADDVGDDGDEVLFAAFTGKAALVMRTKGCRGASTIHSLIYSVEDGPRGQPEFVLNRHSSLRKAALLIIDECSMVGAELAKDLLSFGIKVLVLGDPAQLPPVKDAGYFTEHKPDVMLTEVHRQARDNPIIRVSMDVRNGRAPGPCADGPCRVISRAALTTTDVLGVDQILVGLNKTRVSFNDRIRELRGIKQKMPVVGDKLVCLRNNREKSLLNGGLWTVANVLKSKPSRLMMEIKSEDDDGHHAEVGVHPYFFMGREEELSWPERKLSDEFTYGYALTVHKSQGSQWPQVMLFDESGSFREDRWRHLYTGITRAADRLTIVTRE